MTEIKELILPGEGNDPELWDANARGYCSHVMVRFNNGQTFRLDFHEPIRLHQEIGGDVVQQKEVWAQPELIILPEITLGGIVQAVLFLESKNYFAKRVPDKGEDKFFGKDLVIEGRDFDKLASN